MTDLTERSAIDLRDALARGEISAAEVTRAHLDQIEKRDPDIGAWAYLDGDYAMTQAERLDDYRADPQSGESWSEVRDRLLAKLRDR